MFALGSIGLNGCSNSNYNISKTDENIIELTRPADCKIIEDIRYEIGCTDLQYQILCKDKKGNLSLYHRDIHSSDWRKIIVK